MRLIVTGGCGFIASSFLRQALASGEVERLVNVDVLTYSGRKENVEELLADRRFRNVELDICDPQGVEALVREEKPDAIVNFAAESHVDRSLFAARRFVRTNIEGTLCLLEAARGLQTDSGQPVKFVQVSTDEVYGDLEDDAGFFREDTPLDPRNPYSATKAGGDLLALAFARTHKLWLVVTRASNNYGPRQYPEKLIPLMITNALEDKPLPVYGDGKNVRDWLWVEDHCSGVWSALKRGQPGQVYTFGGASERENIVIVRSILAELKKPETLIRYVNDRPGHDRRYAIDFGKAREHLGWAPKMNFEEGLRRTIAWYVANQSWWRPLRDSSFDEYYAQHYGRLGLKS
jgi:dTDP-glucose 4,6-dehydratase